KSTVSRADRYRRRSALVSLKPHLAERRRQTRQHVGDRSWGQLPGISGPPRELEASGRKVPPRPINTGKARRERESSNPLTTSNLHGKEGVDGSSPSEGFDTKYLQISISCCLYWRAIRGLAGTKRVHIRGPTGTRGQARRRASPCDTPQRTPDPLPP